MEEINARKAALKSTIESLSKPILPLQKELEELEKLSKNKMEKGTK
jgi:prefoldin subunit 5